MARPQLGVTEGSNLSDVVIWCLPTCWIQQSQLQFYTSTVVLSYLLLNTDFILYMKSLTCQLPQVFLVALVAILVLEEKQRDWADGDTLIA